ncbi:MAG: HAMP domain-containing histidine kinase [Nitrosopumilus sp.]|nr:HAMP domain-containing histidine kinase [Nitrosopumilus sp.]MBL7017308.1 HAMP domain-containing histidine kinase [Nitrosopumilus sp.]
MKLNQKIILISIIPLIISTSVVTVIITEMTNDDLLDSSISHIKSLCELTENQMRNPMNNLDIDQMNEIIDNLENQEGIIQVLVLFPDGRLLTDGTNNDFNYGTTFEDNFIQKSIVSSEELLILENNMIRVSKPIILHEKIGILVLDYSTKNIEKSIQISISNIVITSISIITIVGISAIYLSKSISLPILKMKKNVELISKGEIRIESNKSGITELDELSKTIAELGIKIEKYQKELVKKERLSTIGEMAARITHDLRNPLTTIKNSIEILKIKKPEIVKDNQQYFDMMHDAASRMNHQIDEVLGFVKIKQPEKTNVKFQELLSKILETIEVPNNIEIKKPKEDHTIWCDSIQLQNVLINLILNSIQSIGNDQGKITINLEKEDESDKITIEDTGSGIPESSLELIFEPLYTTKQNGTGLGLVSCKNIIESHKGKIYAQNSSKGGVIFTILIPSLKEKE